MSDWGSFSALDDDDDLDFSIDTREYAKEEDSQELKAQVGASLEAPSILNDAEPISVPAGSQLGLDEETVLGVLSACREEIGTVFGYSAENRGVGITGGAYISIMLWKSLRCAKELTYFHPILVSLPSGVDFVEMDGPTVVLSLKGRFWHQRTTVLDRVANYLQQRIPEIIDVVVEDEWQLTDEANEVS
ncbi:MAG: hypothetical protein SGBAC_008291 [Bacillariaceae sp.]